MGKFFSVTKGPQRDRDKGKVNKNGNNKEQSLK